jgi:hypothetical protein
LLLDVLQKQGDGSRDNEELEQASNASIFARTDSEVVGAGRQLAAQVHVTDHAAPIEATPVSDFYHLMS